MLRERENLTERGDLAALWAVEHEHQLRARRFRLHIMGAVGVGMIGVIEAMRRLRETLAGTQE